MVRKYKKKNYRRRASTPFNKRVKSAIMKNKETLFKRDNKQLIFTNVIADGSLTAMATTPYLINTSSTGDKVFATYLAEKYYMTAGSNGLLRILTISPNQAILQEEEVIDEFKVGSISQRVDSAKYRVIRDKTVTFNQLIASQDLVRSGKFFRRINQIWDFDAVNTQTIAEVAKNGYITLYLWKSPTDSTSFPTILVDSSVGYKIY